MCFKTIIIYFVNDVMYYFKSIKFPIIEMQVVSCQSCRKGGVIGNLAQGAKLNAHHTITYDF